MTENEIRELIRRVRSKRYLMRSETDYITKALEEVQQYRAIGTPEECRAAMEKQTAISRELIEGKYFCPKCHNLMPYPGYCGCGQKVY